MFRGVGTCLRAASHRQAPRLQTILSAMRGLPMRFLDGDRGAAGAGETRQAKRTSSTRKG